VPAVLVMPQAHDAAAQPHDVTGASAHELHPLLEVPLPRALGWMDYRGEVDSPEPKTALFNLQIFQVAAVLLILIAFAGVPRYLRTGKGDMITRLFAGFAQWIRDDMVHPIMGKKLGNRFLPYFLSIFFFILFMNLMGLVPYSATATSSIFVTGALAATTFLAMVLCGMAVQGPLAFWKNLVPHVPLALWPLMFVVEVVGLLVKPFALMVRLFANMSGGHMVVLSFMGLIFFLGELWGPAGGWGAAPVGAGFAVFIMIIESFVALLQAFIFTQLSILFVHTSVHPEH
jgi:F-type H+-transporting ATPase subunit a